MFFDYNYNSSAVPSGIYYEAIERPKTFFRRLEGRPPTQVPPADDVMTGHVVGPPHDVFHLA